MRRFLLFLAILYFLPLQTNLLWADPPKFPARVAGTLSIYTPVQMLDEDGILPPQLGKDYDYTIRITRTDGTLLDPDAKDDDGLNRHHSYIIDIPLYDEDKQSDGVLPGETVVIHVFRNGLEIPLISPAQGKITVGEIGSVTEVDLLAASDPETSPLYTQTQLDAAIQEAISTWDINGDGRIGLEEAINALRQVSGVR